MTEEQPSQNRLGSPLPKEASIGTNGTSRGDSSGRVTLRSPEVREIARTLATLGHARVSQGAPLNVRDREMVRRALAEAGEALGWAEVAATSEDPVSTISSHLKKMVRSGIRSLKRGVADELVEKEAEASRLEAVVKTVRRLAEDPDAEYPTEVTYSHTARDPSGKCVTKSATLSLNDSGEALKAARRIEELLPRWEQLREEMLAELRKRQESLSSVTRDLSSLTHSWRRMLREVLLTMS